MRLSFEEGEDTEYNHWTISWGVQSVPRDRVHHSVDKERRSLEEELGKQALKSIGRFGEHRDLIELPETR